MKTKMLICDLDNCLCDTEAIRDAPNDLSRLRLFPDVLGALILIDCEKVLVTSGQPFTQLEKFIHLDIQKYFVKSFFCLKGERKQEIFSELSEKICLRGILSRHVTVVGDRLDLEIKYGNEFGFQTVRMCYGKYADQKPMDHSEIPHYSIDLFSDLIPLL